MARYHEQLIKKHQNVVAALAALQRVCFRARLPSIPELDVVSELTAFQGLLLQPMLADFWETVENRVSPKMWHCVSSVSTGDYSAIRVEELARRGVNHLRPASDTGEQFRDVMLWLMALSYAKDKGREVGLISSDGHFFDSKGLHPQLKDELIREGVELHVSRSIEDFLKADSPSTSIAETWIERYLAVEEAKEIEALFEKAVASYLDLGWRSRSEVTSLGETVWKFKKGMLYTLAPDSLYAELEYEGSAKFAIGPYVYTKAPPFNPKDYALDDVQVYADFVISGWIVAEHITSMELEKMLVHSVSELGPH